MPGVYAPQQWDLAGCCVGVKRSENTFDKQQLKAGDLLIGLESNGLHSNGFSLVRKVLGLDGEDWMEDKCPWNEKELLADELLKPTRIYVNALLELASSNKVKALAHITGGGITENLPRVLPKGINATIVSST